MEDASIETREERHGSDRSDDGQEAAGRRGTAATRAGAGLTQPIRNRQYHGEFYQP